MALGLIAIAAPAICAPPAAALTFRGTLGSNSKTYPGTSGSLTGNRCNQTGPPAPARHTASPGIVVGTYFLTKTRDDIVRQGDFDGTNRDPRGYGKSETYRGFANVPNEFAANGAMPAPALPPVPTPTPTPSGNPAQALNISTRALVGSGDQALIGGFITGNAPKKVILRAIGPSLGGANVQGALSDPLLELHQPDGTVVVNDNWRSSQETAILESGIPPIDDRESAIVRTLDPGTYTAIVRGKNGRTGIGLVEIFDLEQAADSQLANISTRGLVGTGDDVLIGGIFVGPP